MYLYNATHLQEGMFPTLQHSSMCQKVNELKKNKKHLSKMADCALLFILQDAI